VRSKCFRIKSENARNWRPEPLIPWSAPACPFAIGYPARVLDDIRLAVVDAFFSLPRGGAEIGGILLGLGIMAGFRLPSMRRSSANMHRTSFTLSGAR